MVELVKQGLQLPFPLAKLQARLATQAAFASVQGLASATRVGPISTAPAVRKRRSLPE